MKARFEGDDGKRRLIDALQGSSLVGYDAALSARLADSGQLVAISNGFEIIQRRL